MKKTILILVCSLSMIALTAKANVISDANKGAYFLDSQPTLIVQDGLDRPELVGICIAIIIIVRGCKILD